MNWVLLSVASALCLGVYDVCKKGALVGNSVLGVLLASTAVGSAVFVPVLGLGVFWPDTAGAWGLTVAPLTWPEHALVACKSLLVTTSWVCNFFALKHLPISLAAPLRATAPLFTLAGAAILFGERLAPVQWVGAAVIVGAYGAFSVLGRLEGIAFERDRWIGLLAVGTLLGAASGLYDKHLLQGAGLPPLSLQVWFTLDNLVLQVVWVAVVRGRDPRRWTPLRFRGSIVGIGVFLSLADLAYFRALSDPEALISVVSLVRRSNVVVSFTLGMMWFAEARPRPKALALSGVLLGLALLLS